MIKIYVANLGKYVEGSLVGKWLSLPCDMEEFTEVFLPSIEIDNIRYEEYAVHDVDCDIEGLEIGEYTSIEKLNEIAEAYEGLNESQQNVVSAVLEWEGSADIIDIIDNIDDYYLNSEVEDDKSYGEYIIENNSPFCELPSDITQYLDEEAIGRDYYLNGDCHYSSHGLISR